MSNDTSTNVHSETQPAPSGNHAVEAFRKQRVMSRILAVQAAYAMDANNRWECTDESFDEFVTLATSENSDLLDEQYLPKAIQRAQHIVTALCQCHDELDELITSAASNWTINRIHRVERSIMRVAIYEMKYGDNISPAVAINEAIELSKLMGQGDSSRFINGVLDKVRRNLGLSCTNNVSSEG